MIDFSLDTRRSFLHGFVKGFVSPMSLFGKFEAYPQPAVIKVVAASNPDGIARDWNVVSNNIWSAANTIYGEPKNTFKTTKARRRRR